MTAPAAASLRILVVDDDVDCARALARWAQAAGHDVRVCHAGFEALEEADAFHPEVALLDLAMPGMDGCELARRLRCRSWGKSALLIACTGLGGEDDRRRTREAGFDHHLVKPVPPATLREALREARASRRRHVHRSRQDGSAASADASS